MVCHAAPRRSTQGQAGPHKAPARMYVNGFGDGFKGVLYENRLFCSPEEFTAVGERAVNGLMNILSLQ